MWDLLSFWWVANHKPAAFEILLQQHVVIHLARIIVRANVWQML